MSEAQETKAQEERLDMLYLESAGDIVKSFRDWSLGQATADETSITFSSQAFELARKNGWSLLAESYFERRDEAEGAGQRAKTRPRPWAGRGARYHLAEVLNGLRIVAEVANKRPRIVVVSSGACHWFSLLPLKALDVRVIASLHNTPWVAGHPPSSPLKRALLKLDGLFFRHVANAVLCVSPEIARQIESLAGPGQVRVEPHIPQYRPGHLTRPASRRAGEGPFRIVFAGRVEADKGVFDIVEMAARLRERGAPPVLFEICGDGSALPALRAAIEKAGLGAAIVTHGRLDRASLIEVYRRAHIAIVPTRSEFNEGFAMAAAEAVMMGLPVVTSPVVPAAEVLGRAVRMARTDDVDSYVEEITRLMNDPSAYDACCRACEEPARLFTRPELGYEAALARACGAPLPETSEAAHAPL